METGALHPKVDLIEEAMEETVAIEESNGIVHRSKLCQQGAVTGQQG